MTTPACKNCCHWDPTDDSKEHAMPGLRRCTRAKMFWDETEWNDDCDRVLKPEARGSLMFVQDGSDYWATLLTLGDFFCAHFEALEP